VRVGDKLIVEIMQEASVEINIGVLRIVNFFHSDSIEVMLLAISVAGKPEEGRRFSCRIMKPIDQVRENSHSFF